MIESRPSLSRRQFIKLAAGSGAGLSLVVAMDGCEAPDAEQPFQPSLWVRIDDDGSVTVMLAESEMGQGVTTALPMLVAEELEVSLDVITVLRAPLTSDYGRQITGGSSSVRSAWQPLRKAGATAREMLKMAAAREWGVPVASCTAGHGRVFRNGTEISLSYGELASKAALIPVPKDVPLKGRKEFTLLGRAMQEFNLAAKVSGKTVFASDVSIEGMRVAAIRHCPVFGGTLQSYDETPVSDLPGVKVVPLATAIAAVADTYWQAAEALKKIEVNWHDGSAASLGTEAIKEKLFHAIETKGHIYRSEGNALDAFTKAPIEHQLSAEFVVPFQAHATMEPMCCAAHVANGKCEIWISSQAPSNARDVAFEVAFSGMPKYWHKFRKKLELGFIDPVTVNQMEMGGGFGRRLENDVVRQAVQIAKAVKEPVKLIWSREEDIQHDFYRPMTAHRLDATVDMDGKPQAWIHRFAGPDARPGGARDLPYSIPAVHVEGHDIETPVPVGPWRSIDHSYNGFVTECFIDELATIAGKDPVRFRLQLLDNSPRLANVLNIAADRAGWFDKRIEGRHLGVAAHSAFGTFVAQVAEISVGSNGRISVHRIVCVMDCGQMINPNTVRAQVEGSIVFALSSALKSSITISNGRTDQSNFHDFTVLRMNEMPDLDIFLVDSEEDPGGVGEPAVPPTAPAVANAVYAATGQRQRSQPFGFVNRV